MTESTITTLERLKEFVSPRQECSSAARKGVTSCEGRPEPEGLIDLLDLSIDALEDEGTDPSFDMDSSIKSDTCHIAENFCEDWVTKL